MPVGHEHTRHIFSRFMFFISITEKVALREALKLLCGPGLNAQSGGSLFTT